MPTRRTASLLKITLPEQRPGRRTGPIACAQPRHAGPRTTGVIARPLGHPGRDSSARSRGQGTAIDGALAVSAPPAEDYANELRLERIRAARIRGYEGDSCEECGNFTLIRNSTCLKCDTCGATSGCS